MKNVNIQKINKMGKAVRILTKIAMIFSIIGAVFSAVGTGVLQAAFTDDLFRADGTVNASVYVSGDAVPDNPLVAEGGSITVNDEVTFSKEKIDVSEFLTLWMDNVEEENGEVRFDISSNIAEDFSIPALRKEFTTKLITAMLMCVTLAIGMGFASSLAGAIEKCETPFCEDVVKRMKAFGWSMIPYAVFGGIGGGIQIAICVITVVIMVYIFSYGCSLQTENDDMV